MVTESSSSSSQAEVKNVAVPVPAPVVVTKTAVSLADHLKLSEMPLATTPAGKVFAMKALHPADSEIKTSRVPGGTTPSFSIAADAIETIGFPAGATACQVIQWPNPMIPLTVTFTDASGNWVDNYTWTNSALGGSGFLHNPQSLSAITSSFGSFTRNFERYRVTAQSVTCEVIAPAVADQGTITSAQQILEPMTIQASSFTSGGNINEHVDFWLYHDPPAENQLLMGTSAYTSKAREGFYQPLKLDKFKWVNCQDKMLPLPNLFYSSGMIQHSSVPFNLSNYPVYFGSAAVNISATDIALVKPSSNVVGVTFISGTAGNPQVSIRVRARQVVEVIPVLGSSFAPLAEAPYPPDDLAIRMVKEISGRMKDAYPASYNDLGKLKDTIIRMGKGVIKYADPALNAISMIPGLGNVAAMARNIGTVTKGVTALLEGVKSQPAKSQKKPQKQQPKQGPPRKGKQTKA